jgi:hypothetical protein
MSAWHSTSGTASIEPQQKLVPFARILNTVSLAVVAGSISLAVGAIPASATLTITAEQVGSDVIVSALGSLDFSTFFHESVGSYSPPGLPPPPVSFLFTGEQFGTPTINLATTGDFTNPISSLKRFRSYMFGSGPALTGMTTSAQPRRTPLPAASVVESVQVNVVNVDVLVTDRDGRPVTGLTAADFTLYEDGKPMSITTSAVSAMSPFTNT